MPPLNYVNFYILSFFGFLGSIFFGAFYFYRGMQKSSYIISNAVGSSLYYLDKNQYDMYLNGLVYCLTFMIALILFIAVIIVPSMSQIQQRMAMPYSSGYQGTPANARSSMPQGTPMQPQMAPMQAPPMEAPAASKPAAPEAPKSPTLDELDEIEEESSRPIDSSGDADVVYGTGKITEESVIEFIHRHPDSALKYVFNKNIDGKPLGQKEGDIYAGWGKRGLSRAKARDYILQIMEWESMPDLPIHEIWTQLRDQIFELTH
jgi:hypothetical protein